MNKVSNQYKFIIEGFDVYNYLHKILWKTKNIDFYQSVMDLCFFKTGKEYVRVYIHYKQPTPLPEIVLEYKPKFLKCDGTIHDNYFSLQGNTTPLYSKGELD